MSEKQWVCHISGKGEKWSLMMGSQITGADFWIVYKSNTNDALLYLPKSEYRLCPAPEVWRDVTEECDPSDAGKLLERNWDSGWIIKHGDRVVTCNDDYQFRKVEVNLIGPNYQYGCKKAWAFVIEQKVPA